MMSNIYDYSEGELPERPFLDDDCYDKSIRVNINPCTDCLIVNLENKSVYLPVRKNKTGAGLWFIGGIWKSQVTARENMTICFNRETGLDIKGDRFVRIPFSDEDNLPPQTLWPTGRHDMHFFYSISLTESELVKVNDNLDDSEYDKSKKLQEFTREQLVEAGAREIVIDCFDKVMEA